MLLVEMPANTLRIVTVYHYVFFRFLVSFFSFLFKKKVMLLEMPASSLRIVTVYHYAYFLHVIFKNPSSLREVCVFVCVSGSAFWVWDWSV
jgi:hypothetical protein